jgi:hypothetical protein
MDEEIALGSSVGSQRFRLGFLAQALLENLVKSIQITHLTKY